MKILWSEEKNDLLKETRNVSFEQVVEEIEAGRFTKPQTNPSRPINS